MTTSPPPHAAPAARRVAVVIDHDESVRDLLADVLRQAGFVVISAPDGTAGIEAVVRHEPTLVTLEMDLPGRDGVSLAGEIRRLTIAPIIMISDHGDEIDVVRSLSAGADTYVVKPFRLREFRARVEALMRRPEQASAVHAVEVPDQRDAAPGDTADDDWVATALASLGPDGLTPVGHDRTEDDWVATAMASLGPDGLTPVGSDRADDDWVATTMAVLGVDGLTPPDVDGEAEAEVADFLPYADPGPELSPDDAAAPSWAAEETPREPEQRPEAEHPLPAVGDPEAREAPEEDGPEHVDHVDPDAVRPSEGWEDFRGLAVNRAHRLIEVDHRPVEASAAQFDALAAILTTGRGLRSRVDLAAVISGRSAAQVTAEDRVHVDAEMADLFDKLGESREAPRWIDVIPGVGYRRIAL